MTEQAPTPGPDGRAAARARIAQQHTWVDLQIQRAIERGDFDNLPGAGKPLPDLGDSHDPDWWIKKLIEREHVTVLPESLQLRKEDAALDGRLDEMTREADVRREIEEFNARVIAARYRLPEGPPLITMPREVEATISAWAERRRAAPDSSDGAQSQDRRHSAPESRGRVRRWWRSRREIRHTDE